MGMDIARRVREVLDYDPVSGLFVWRDAPGVAKHRIGKPVGARTSRWYPHIKIGRLQLPAHRVAYLWMTGTEPVEEIDHINGIPSDNRWSNLRLASPSQNGANCRISSRNSSGFKGVSWYKRTRKWHARIVVKRKYLHLGYFDTAELAHAAYATAARTHFGEFARLK